MTKPNTAKTIKALTRIRVDNLKNYERSHFQGIDLIGKEGIVVRRQSIKDTWLLVKLDQPVKGYDHVYLREENIIAI